MKILSWDTSSNVGVVSTAIAKEESPQVSLVSEWTLNVQATHSERLLWAIDKVLDASDWKLSDIDTFVVGVGPGSFTGLRIGLTTARTMATSLKKPLVGVSSLAWIARSSSLSLLKGQKVIYCLAVDACKGEVFSISGSPTELQDCSVFRVNEGSSLWNPAVRQEVLDPGKLVSFILEWLETHADGRFCLIGNARLRYKEAFSRLPRDREILMDRFSEVGTGRVLAQLGWEAFQAGFSVPAGEIYPDYLRASNAELRLKARGLLEQS